MSMDMYIFFVLFSRIQGNVHVLSTSVGLIFLSRNEWWRCNIKGNSIQKSRKRLVTDEYM